ncbi:class I SAM-dependent methyltransferase, partial [Vibrio sp. FNV 38]|nr:class I SAM-dependent methyltransferase [Vibrio sp. FNV 38]
YDTFGIRNKDASLSIYELDLPEMLADKKAKIEEAGLTSRVIYVPCDLSEGSWKDKLAECGFMCGRRTFCSMLGISYYLSRDEFKKLLKTLGSILSEGSAVCFDYPSKDKSQETQTNRILAGGANEKMKAQYAEQELVTLLEECGFLIYEHLD